MIPGILLLATGIFGQLRKTGGLNRVLSIFLGFSGLFYLLAVVGYFFALDLDRVYLFCLLLLTVVQLIVAVFLSWLEGFFPKSSSEQGVYK